jgi:uncharacterized surface protein with fasciclin (FAS1) repeats
MTKTHIFTLFVLGLILLSGCDPDQKVDKYDRPDWLAGKVYTQLLDQPDLSTFARCVELTGYDTIIDRSGTYTVFAPNNEAFTTWFQEHPLYNEVEDIPLEELQKLVKYHLVQSPWSKLQLQSLDVWGWIDTLDVNNDQPKGYKRETLLLEENRKLGIGYSESDESIKIVDTTQSNWHRVYLTDSRKFSPIFFKDYFDIYNLSSSDYSFYYDRSIESSKDIYYSGAKIIGEEVFAENGFVYNIDRVVEPLLNAYEILGTETEGQSYAIFQDLINRFPEFQYNEDATFDQPGADQGFEVDSLFDLTFPELAFDILNEATTSPRGTFGLPSDVSIRYHHGMAAPNDQAVLELEQKYLAGTGRWGSLENAPKHIKRIITNTHLSTNPIYTTDFTVGFVNGENDRVYIDEGDIIQKEYGSNATFVGLDQAIVPRAFSSVTGPVYQLRGYSYSMYAIEQAGLLAALKRENEDYMLFVETDQDCQDDSSLWYDYSSESFFLFQGSGENSQRYNLDVNELRTLILNHVGTRNPYGSARKEFIKNLAGNYLIVDNVTGEVSGTAPTSEGYKGDILVPEFPELISEDADNGNTFRIRNWFSFTATNLYLKISVNFPEFQRLLNKAGLTDKAFNRYNFLSENENYTVFAPTDSALFAIQADTLPIPDLQRLLMLHFVQGGLIFTDASASPGYYETTRIDERSTEFSTIFSSIYINPGMDYISIPDSGGGEFVSVEESEDANMITGRNLGEGSEVFPVVVNNAVIHKIERVLQINDLDSN